MLNRGKLSAAPNQLLLFGLIALLCLHSPLANGKEPKFPAPKNATVKHMGNSVQTNGLVMQVRQFNTKDDMDRVRAFYKKQWPRRDDDPGVIESDAAEPWIVLSRFEDGYMLTVQMQETDLGGTWGYLAKSRLPKADEPVKRIKPPASMRGTKVLSSNESHDDGQSGQVFLLGNKYTVQSNVTFYRNLYDGWRVDLDEEMAGGQVLAFTRGSKRVNMTIVDSENGSVITINIIDKSLL